MIKTFPYLEISGTNYEVGAAVGEMFRGKIQEVIKDRKHYIRKYQELLESTKPYVHNAEVEFPHLIEEMTGMADGADIPFLDLFFHNCPEVYDHTLEWDREQAQTEDHCTIAVSCNKTGVLIGHNEDWVIDSLDELFVMKATINGVTILALDYATFLTGSSASINNFGLIQCINELHQTPGKGVPKYFLARAVMDCKTIAEAEKLIRTTKSASGYNHLLVQNKEICDIELTGENIDVALIKNQPYVHTNHCISEHTKPYDINVTKSSLARYKRAKELVKNNMTKDEMKALLSDTKNATYPICRENVTIGSVIIDAQAKTMDICYGMPINGTFIPYHV